MVSNYADLLHNTEYCVRYRSNFARFNFVFSIINDTQIATVWCRLIGRLSTDSIKRQPNRFSPILFFLLHSFIVCHTTVYTYSTTQTRNVQWVSFRIIPLQIVPQKSTFRGNATNEWHKLIVQIPTNERYWNCEWKINFGITSSSRFSSTEPHSRNCLDCTGFVYGFLFMLLVFVLLLTQWTETGAFISISLSDKCHSGRTNK